MGFTGVKWDPYKWSYFILQVLIIDTGPPCLAVFTMDHITPKHANWDSFFDPKEMKFNSERLLIIELRYAERIVDELAAYIMMILYHPMVGWWLMSMV